MTFAMRDDAAWFRPCAAGPVLDITFSASFAEVRRVLLTLPATLAQAGFGDGLRVTAEIVLAEALNNVSEHAFVGRTGMVRLRLDRADGGLACVIEDDGRELPADLVLPQALPDCGDLPEGGFGWHLIRTLTRRICYARVDGMNRLSLVIAE